MAKVKLMQNVTSKFEVTHKSGEGSPAYQIVDGPWDYETEVRVSKKNDKRFLLVDYNGRDELARAAKGSLFEELEDFDAGDKVVVRFAVYESIATAEQIAEFKKDGFYSKNLEQGAISLRFTQLSDPAAEE